MLKMAGVSTVVMTNDPLDPEEMPVWMKGVESDPQISASVAARSDLCGNGPIPGSNWSARGTTWITVRPPVCISEIRRFLSDWCRRMRPIYMAVSLPDTFQFPADAPQGILLREAVLPACREFDLPLSLMIGVRRQVNPRIRLAGDAVGRADLRSLETLCSEYPDNRFLVSVLSRENQHELCVYARKFSNLMPFGCWWFLNNPSIVEEITRETD